MRIFTVLLALGMAVMASAPALAAAVDGMAIRSTVRGEGETIIFVHGWTCDDSSWDAQVPAFARDYRVVTLDLPGHGKSQSPARAEDFSMDLFAAAVEAVRAEIGADKVVLVGHSMGAGVIRTYALRYPGRVAGLVAVDGALDVRPWTRFGNRGPMTRERRASAIESMFVDSTAKELRDHIRTMMMGASDTTAAGASAALVSPDNLSDELIMAPALTVWAGTRVMDEDFDTRDMLPNWEDVRMAGTGHFLMMEQPEGFNAILRAFVEQRARF